LESVDQAEATMVVEARLHIGVGGRECANHKLPEFLAMVVYGIHWGSSAYSRAKARPLSQAGGLDASVFSRL
jgi:hypothetical protein